MLRSSSTLTLNRQKPRQAARRIVDEGQTFDLEDAEGVKRTFEVTRMHAEFVARQSYWETQGAQLVILNLTQEAYDHCMKHGIEEEHLERVNTTFNYPGILCTWPDETEYVVDGNHRLVKRFRMGLREMLVWRLPKNVWELFVR